MCILLVINLFAICNSVFDLRMLNRSLLLQDSSSKQLIIIVHSLRYKYGMKCLGRQIRICISNERRCDRGLGGGIT